MSETLAGRRATYGTNFYGVAGRTAGAVEGFGGHSDGMRAASEKGPVWTEEDFVGIVQTPAEDLRAYFGEASVRSTMTYKVGSEEDAKDLFAYLPSLGRPASN